jgi:ureidoglycolate hydrolase
VNFAPQGFLVQIPTEEDGLDDLAQFRVFVANGQKTTLTFERP